MKTILHLCASLLFALNLNAQTTFCPDDPPVNSFLADSPWPTYHRNNYAQASTCLRGPEPGDSLRIVARTNIQGGTSPWVYLTDRYSSGERALIQSNATHIFKFIDDGEQIVAVDSLRIDFDPITSFGWNFLLTNNQVWFTYDPKYDPEEEEFTRLFKITDAEADNPYSELQLVDTFNFGPTGINRIQQFNLNYKGEIVFNSENDEEQGWATVGVLDQNFNLLDTLHYTTSEGEIVHHNAFPIDEDNSFFIVTTHRMIKFTWDGSQLAKAWEAAYDFVADGPTGSFAEGSGTTPTLMGWGEGQDKLVVVADGHADNNLVAFWRELPEDWTGVPGMDIHFADSIRIPLAQTFSNLFQSIENSPTVRDYDIAIGQFNGFLGYDCENIKGVQKFHWNTTSNEWELAWVNDAVNMNGVLTYSGGSDLLYGSGKEADCNYYYYGLDWQSGEEELRILLGPEGTFLDDPFYDAGNNNIIDENGNIYFPGGGSLIKLEVVERLTTTENLSTGLDIKTFPNPTNSKLFIEIPAEKQSLPIQLDIVNLQGQRVSSWNPQQLEIDLGEVPAGVYFLRIQVGEEVQWNKITKN
ncbi:MAG: T9SS type A sorting domain-containing protein [Bacteroidota bacterium]